MKKKTIQQTAHVSMVCNSSCYGGSEQQETQKYFQRKPCSYESLDGYLLSYSNVEEHSNIVWINSMFCCLDSEHDVNCED